MASRSKREYNPGVGGENTNQEAWNIEEQVKRAQGAKTQKGNGAKLRWEQESVKGSVSSYEQWEIKEE